MVDVAEYFNLDITTTHAAIAYLDRLQPTDKYSRYEWQMMAICCIIISAKYNEREEDVPPLRKLEEITQQRIPNEVILNYELWALKRMSWKLNGKPLKSLSLSLSRSLSHLMSFFFNFHSQNTSFFLISLYGTWYLTSWRYSIETNKFLF